MGERSGGLKPGNIWKGRVRSEVEKYLSAASSRVPPSFNVTSSVFGATKRPFPMINSAPLAL